MTSSATASDLTICLSKWEWNAICVKIIIMQPMIQRPATPSYTLFNVGAGTDIRNHGKTIATIIIQADNITNRAYQNHLSRLKYADTNPVTGRRGVYNMGRNVIFKVVLPII
jgi:hypothetical protein